MESFCFLDSANCEPQGKMIDEMLPRKPSFGSVGRRRLSDITNSQHHLKSPKHDKHNSLSFTTKEYIEQLQKENLSLRQENMAFRQHLQERNKLLELTGIELTKMKINIQKLQQQNRLLAQTNSQMTLERTLDKDRLKVLQHELGCRGALLAVKDVELEDEMEEKQCQNLCNAKTSKEREEKAADDGDDYKRPRNLKQRRQSKIQSVESCAVEEQVEATSRRRQPRRIQSLVSPAVEEQAEESKEMAYEKRSLPFGEEVKGGPVPANGVDDEPCILSKSRRSRTQNAPISSAVKEQETTKEKPENRRQSARFKIEPEQTDEKLESKRPCLRKQSACTKSEQTEPTEDLFEMEDARFPATTLLDENMQDTPTSTTEVKEEKNGWNLDTPALRTSIGRPMRKAAVKVQSYKEKPLNVKMRRSE